MGKISKSVSKGLGAAIAEAQAKLEDSTAEIEGFPGEHTVEALLNSGAEAQKKRKRRTKAEIEAEKQTNPATDEFSEMLGIAPEEEPEEDNRPEWEKRRAVDHDEFCKWEIEKAHLKGTPEPDFDFRNYYEKGQIVYFVRIMESLGEKEVKKLLLRTIYPRMMVGSEEKAACQCIGYNDRDKIFLTPRDADNYSKSIKLTSKYASEDTGSKRKKNIEVDEDDDGDSDNSASYERLQEALKEDD